MKTMTCEDVRLQLLDYIEHELDDGQRERLGEHLLNCPQCLGELHEIERLHGALDHELVPDPGAAFWREFPDQVWRAYRNEQSTALRPSLAARIWKAALAGIRSGPGPVRWLPATAAVGLVAGIALFLALGSSRAPDTAAFQARIHGGPDAAFAQRQILELPAEQHYGFAAASGASGFFRIGHDYARSLVSAAGGDASGAHVHLAAMVDALAAPPDALASLVRGNPSRSQVAALEPELSRIAERAGAREAASFRAGTWLANLALAVALRDATALKEAVPEIRRLRRDLEDSGAAPPDALRDLGTLADLLARANLTEGDYQRAAGLIREIQLILI